MKYVSLNQKILPEDQASIPITDRGFIFGEGVFTTMKLEEGAVEYLDQHINRLQEHVKAIKIKAPQEINLAPLIKKNHAETGTWRVKVILTGQTELITLTPYKKPKGPSRLILYPEPIHSPIAKWKTLSYLPYTHMKRYAQEKGYDDAILTTKEGYILETTNSNLYWIEGNTLYTPDSTLPYLKGIALSELEKKYTVKEVRCRLDEIPKNATVYQINCMMGSREVKLS